MSQNNHKVPVTEIQMEAEERRLLESFTLHELESRMNANHVDEPKDKEGLCESQVEGEDNEPMIKSKALLKEGDILDGTFGDPNKLPKRDHLDYSQKSDEENQVLSDPKSKTVAIIRHEPGPAFTNSSFKEGASTKDDGIQGPSENPFYWADNSPVDNMAKLVSYNHIVKNQTET